MDSRNYPQIVQELLDRHAQGKPSFGNYENILATKDLFMQNNENKVEM
jgi:hypothetical protein